MSKKEYKKPVMKVGELESTDCLLTNSDVAPTSIFEEIEFEEEPQNKQPYTGPWG